jgi:hypothetical protein
MGRFSEVVISGADYICRDMKDNFHIPIFFGQAEILFGFAFRCAESCYGLWPLEKRYDAGVLEVYMS